MKFAIIREGKTPPDSRVLLTPQQCADIKNNFDLDLVVEKSEVRTYKDEEYENKGLQIVDNVADCDVLLGVKEVPINELKEGKTYCFFSHTHKKQVYNRPLLQAVLDKKIHLIDYEVLTNDKGMRLIAFGFFAGMVGAHNGIVTYGLRTGKYNLKRLKDCFDYEDAKNVYKTLALPAMKIVLTGTGRVASGAAMVLKDMGIEQVSPQDFLAKEYNQAVFTQLACEDYAARKDGSDFVLQDFFENSQEYKNIFTPYTKVADLMINGIFWVSTAPSFFTVEEMASPDFNIQVIADVTCDIAPVSSIPSTLRASTIADHIFGFDPKTGKETAAFQDNCVDMMTIDNLPSELPRDASKAFGDQFIKSILPEFLKEDSAVINRATIAKDGKLGEYFEYLEDFVAGK